MHSTLIRVIVQVSVLTFLATIVACADSENLNAGEQRCLDEIKNVFNILDENDCTDFKSCLNRAFYDLHLELEIWNKNQIARMYFITLKNSIKKGNAKTPAEYCDPNNQTAQSSTSASSSDTSAQSSTLAKPSDTPDCKKILESLFFAFESYEDDIIENRFDYRAGEERCLVESFDDDIVRNVLLYGVINIELFKTESYLACLESYTKFTEQYQNLLNDVNTHEFIKNYVTHVANNIAYDDKIQSPMEFCTSSNWTVSDFEDSD